MLRLEWDAVNRTQVGSLLSIIFLLLATLLGFTLYWLDRSEPAYLWLGAACIAGFLGRSSVMHGVLLHDSAHGARDRPSGCLLGPLSLGLWALFWAYWFKLENIRNIARITWTLTVLLCIGMSMVRPPLFGMCIPVRGFSPGCFPLTLVLKLSLGVLLLWVTYRGMRKRTADGWLALRAHSSHHRLGLPGGAHVLHVPLILRHLWPDHSPIGIIAIFLMLAIISILMMRRFIRGQRDKLQLQLEIEQARQVQQLLIPETIPAIPRFLRGKRISPRTAGRRRLLSNPSRCKTAEFWPSLATSAERARPPP